MTKIFHNKNALVTQNISIVYNVYHNYFYSLKGMIILHHGRQLFNSHI